MHFINSALDEYVIGIHFSTWIIYSTSQQIHFKHIQILCLPQEHLKTNISPITSFDMSCSASPPLLFFNSAELDVEASIMVPWRYEIMRVRESKVITIKTLGFNQNHITHFKAWQRNANRGGR